MTDSRAPVADDRRELGILIVDDEELGRQRLRELLAAESGVRIVAECCDGGEAIRAIQQHAPDVAFLDVQMPEITGIDVVESLEEEERPLVVFVTAHDEFAVRAFDANAVDYLLKPFDNARFRTTLARVRQRLHERNAPNLAGLVQERNHRFPNRLVVRRGMHYEIVRAEDIDWFEAADNYVKLHVGRHMLLYRGTLSGLEQRLDPRAFVRIHRSTMVNAARVKAIQSRDQADFYVILLDGTRLPSSRSYRARVRSILR